MTGNLGFYLFFMLVFSFSSFCFFSVAQWIFLVILISSACAASGYLSHATILVSLSHLLDAFSLLSSYTSLWWLVSCPHFSILFSLHFSAFLFPLHQINQKHSLMCFSTIILKCSSSLTLTSHFLSFRITYWLFSHIIRKQVLQFPSLFTQHSRDFIFLDQDFCGFFPHLFFFQLQLCS